MCVAVRTKRKHLMFMSGCGVWGWCKRQFYKIGGQFGHKRGADYCDIRWRVVEMLGEMAFVLSVKRLFSRLSVLLCLCASHSSFFLKALRFRSERNALRGVWCCFDRWISVSWQIYKLCKWQIEFNTQFPLDKTGKTALAHRHDGGRFGNLSLTLTKSDHSKHSGHQNTIQNIVIMG